MVHKEMHRWVCEYVFRNYMNADRNEMATELRISERMLIFFAVAGGSVGALMGMYICRHKNRTVRMDEFDWEK